MPQTSSIFAGIVLLGTTLLAANVSRLRIAEGTRTKGSSNLDRAIRLHLNNVEHGLPFVIMLVLLELLRLGNGWVVTFGVAWLVIRVVHGVGFIGRGKTNYWIHVTGAGMAYVLLVVMAVTLIVVASTAKTSSTIFSL